ncbi:MAG: hypothetical protein ABIJ09_26295 [Pseudomonadota bacterium]
MTVRTSLPLLVASLGLISLADVVRLQLPPHAAQVNEVIAPPAEFLLALTLGHRWLSADLAWLDATSYYGGKEGAEVRYARLASTLDRVVTLDPHFRSAYLFGGLALTTSLEGVEAADVLLERGAQRFTRDWRFPFYLGFNAMVYREDLPRAARYFMAAASLPDCPPYLQALATSIAASTGNCVQSLQWLAQLQAQAHDPMVRDRLDERRRHIVWECNYQLLEAASASYAQRLGHAPASLSVLVEQGVLPGLPEDPYGGRWGLDGDGKVTSSTRRKRLRVHLPASAVEELKQW